MHFSKNILVAVSFSLAASGAFSQEAKKPSKTTASYIEYSKLDHEIAITELRAGNHDPKGVNSYYFNATLYALKKDVDEKKLGLDKRLHLTKIYDDFGMIEIAALTSWTGEPALGMKFSGNDLRVLTTEAMRAWKLPEEQIALLVDVAMYEKAKRFWFFGEDRLIGRMRYYVIPEKSPHAAPRENRELVLEDNFGTRLKLSIKYAPDEPVATAAATLAE